MRSNLFSKGALAAIVAAPLVLVGCGGDSITGSSPSEAGSALVRVAHLSPDAPAVDVLVNGARVVTGAAFGDATGYLALPAGSARIQVVPAGAWKRNGSPGTRSSRPGPRWPEQMLGSRPARRWQQTGRIISWRFSLRIIEKTGLAVWPDAQPLRAVEAKLAFRFILDNRTLSPWPNGPFT